MEAASFRDRCAGRLLGGAGQGWRNFERRDGRCWYDLAKFRAVFAEYKDVSDYDVAKQLYVKSGIGWKDTVGWDRLYQPLAYGVGIPFVTLIIGWSMIWVISGFRQSTDLEK